MNVRGEHFDEHSATFLLIMETAMRSLRFLKTQHSYADFSTTLSPAIELALERSKTPSTIVLNVFGEDSITVGYFDDPVKSVDLEFCKNANIIVRRRQNAGGAVFGEKGGALIAIYLDARHSWVQIKNIKDAFSISLEALTSILHDYFRINALYRPLNDIEVEGRKLIASSARLERDILTIRLLINVVPTNRDILDKILITPPEKVLDKKIKELGKRFTSLEEEIGTKILYKDLLHITYMLVKRVFGDEVEIKDGSLNDLEKQYASEYLTKFSSNEWFYANSEVFRFREVPQDAVVVEGRAKAQAGLIRATLLIKNGVMVDLIITGDFHPRPSNVLEDMENILRNKECEKSLVEMELSKIFVRSDVEIPGTEVQDFVKAFKRAFHDYRTRISA